MTDTQLSPEPSRNESAEETAREVARLEELLRERASELQGQKTRARNAEALVRDLMAQLEAAGRLSLPSDDLSSLRARTLEAEIGRAELQLRFDELLGHFTALSARTDDPDNAGDNARDDSRAELEAARAAHAELAARERTLRAALSEAEENRDIAYARATLLDHDLALMRDARAEAIRETAEAREQLELAIMQATTLTAHFENGLSGVKAEALLGELSGMRYRLVEQERALSIARTLLEAARADGQEQRRLLGQTRVELFARQGDHREYASRAEHLERELARERERLREMALQNARQTAESDSLREELAAALSSATLTQNALRVLEEDASAAGRDAGSARAVANVAAQRSVALTQAVHVARRALVSLQTQLRLVHDESLAGSSDPTEPGTPLSFDEIEGEP
jgi:hypothetical protein